MVTETSSMFGVMEACRERFGPAPRTFSLLTRHALRVQPPQWLRKAPKDGLWQIYRDRALLLRGGRVVWGALVQANRLLFSPGLTDSPAAAVYSLDPFFGHEPEALRKIGQALFALKDTKPTDPALWKLAYDITNERERSLNIAVPMSLTEGREVFYGSIVVHRQDLPDRCLVTGLFPLIVHPEETPAAMILPSRFWGSELISLWRPERTKKG